MTVCTDSMTLSPNEGRETPEGERAPGGTDDAEPGDRRRPATACVIQLSFDCEDTAPPAAGWLDGLLRQVTDQLDIHNGSLELVVVDDKVMAHLHQEHCNLPGTTDVLTFDLRDQPSDPLDAEIILCRDEAARQAAKRGHEVRVELLLYAVHGLLHLLGEDDHQELAYQRMHQREDEVLTAIGIGPVFRRQGPRERKGRS